jgi:hypothetical protein
MPSGSGRGRESQFDEQQTTPTPADGLRTISSNSQLLPFSNPIGDGQETKSLVAGNVGIGSAMVRGTGK